MAGAAIVASNSTNADPAPTKKGRNSRKALKQKDSSLNEANILAQTLSVQPSESPISNPPDTHPAKENHESLSQSKSQTKKAAKGKSKQAVKNQDSFGKDLQELQEMLEKMKIEKEKTEEILKEKDEMLKIKEEELEVKGKEQEKLQLELKKLQKMKEFKPNVSFPLVQSLKNNDQDKKKKKGCQEIKRPSTPYALWLKDQWDEVKKENTVFDFKAISNMLGAKWKTISEEEKKPYEEKYQAEREAYLQVMAKEKRETEAMKLLEEDHKQKTAMELLDQYVQFVQEAEKDNKKSKKEKDPLKPKHPMSAYFIFSNERRAALVAENKNVKEIAKITGEEWKNMDEKQKAPYEEIAKQNREKYNQEMEVYKQMKEEEAMNHKKEEEEQMMLQKLEAFQLLKKKEKTDNIIKKNKENHQKKKQQNNDPNKPKKPAGSYFLFSKEARKALLEERPGTNNSTINALISVKWKELTEEEKQVWNAKAAEAMEAYKKELEAYNSSIAADNKPEKEAEDEPEPEDEIPKNEIPKKPRTKRDNNKQKQQQPEKEEEPTAAVEAEDNKKIEKPKKTRKTKTTKLVKDC